MVCSATRYDPPPPTSPPGQVTYMCVLDVRCSFRNGRGRWREGESGHAIPGEKEPRAPAATAAVAAAGARRHRTSDAWDFLARSPAPACFAFCPHRRAPLSAWSRKRQGARGDRGFILGALYQAELVCSCRTYKVNTSNGGPCLLGGGNESSSIDRMQSGHARFGFSPIRAQAKTLSPQYPTAVQARMKNMRLSTNPKEAGDDGRCLVNAWLRLVIVCFKKGTSYRVVGDRSRGGSRWAAACVKCVR